ncbi:major histocompatibility complex class I-related gene protein isoform X2 [Alligator mississippiensis]|uniref:major histocompatibility complex class I-related gene protein isoform X2 n=1 Tax=Alligator mississippiensis TaxID=8496 RepID=UPI002877F6A1|nr:major histocompatibility complex class I-related gene protein isoform X2 [Alligator mississippiensis]XP_059581369.1 major histocompatibility complex class I-related gene protein isoform X2 [Alligator mississippiensis]
MPEGCGAKVQGKAGRGRRSEARRCTSRWKESLSPCGPGHTAHYSKTRDLRGAGNQLQLHSPQQMAGTTPQWESWGLSPTHTAPSLLAPCSDPTAPCERHCILVHLSLHGMGCCARTLRLQAPQGASVKVVPGSRLLLLLLLVGTAAVPGTSASFHSYQHLYTGVSDPGPDVPAFTAVSYVDDQQILHYDSETQRQEPRADWVLGAIEPDFWKGETMSLRSWQDGFKRNLVTLQHRYNQTGESHTLQLMYGCKLREDNSTGGYMQLGYDGGDFISYDLGTRTWVAETTQAQVTQRSWNEDKAFLQITSAYLEETCIEWLWKYLQCGEAVLQRKRPMAQVSDGPSQGGRTTLSCRVHGFYPKDVAVVWVKNGEAQPQETTRSEVFPSGDGTYQTWATIEIDPSRNHNYVCSVEHESLGAALRESWDKGRTKSDLIPIVGIVIGFVAVAIGIIVCHLYFPDS